MSKTIRAVRRAFATTAENDRWLLKVARRDRTTPSTVLHRLVETARLAEEAATAARRNPADRRAGVDRRHLSPAA